MISGIVNLKVMDGRIIITSKGCKTRGSTTTPKAQNEMVLYSAALIAMSDAVEQLSKEIGNDSSIRPRDGSDNGGTLG